MKTQQIPQQNQSQPGLAAHIRKRPNLTRSFTAAVGLLTAITLQIAGPIQLRAANSAVRRLPMQAPTAGLCRPPEVLSVLSRTYQAEAQLSIDLPMRKTTRLAASISSRLRPPNLGFIAKPFPPTHHVEGRIRFRHVQRGPDILRSVSEPNFPQYAHKIESIQTSTVRHAKIVLEDDQGHYIPGKLNESGEFSFDWIPSVGKNGRITVWSVSHQGSRNAAVGRWVGGSITHTDQLTNDTRDYSPFSYSQVFELADASIVNGGLSLDVVVPEADDSAPAFWLLENGLIALDYFLGIDGVGSMPKLNIVYSPGLILDEGDLAFYAPGKDPGFIYMPPNYGWVDFAVRHEAGHCFQTHYLRNAEYKRIGEPLANAHALAMVGSPWMDKPGTQTFENLDVQPNFIDDAFRLEDGQGDYWTYCDGCEDLNYSYGWVQRALWDLLDGTEAGDAEPLASWFPYGSETEVDAGEFDLVDGGGSSSVAGGDHVLNDVLVNYLGGGVLGIENPHYQDRGAVDVDLVDVLDGMVCRGYVTPEEIERLVNHAMEFGYESAGPGLCD